MIREEQAIPVYHHTKHIDKTCMQMHTQRTRNAHATHTQRTRTQKMGSTYRSGRSFFETGILEAFNNSQARARVMSHVLLSCDSMAGAHCTIQCHS